MLDWIYSTFVEHMDEKQRKEFDWQLEQIADGGASAAERAKQQRRELARLNAHRRKD